jgi:hypothetical protein
MASSWSLARAADHLFGDNLPSGAEVHIERLAKLLDEAVVHGSREAFVGTSAYHHVIADNMLHERKHIVDWGRAYVDKEVKRLGLFTAHDMKTFLDMVERGEHGAGSGRG